MTLKTPALVLLTLGIFTIAGSAHGQPAVSSHAARPARPPGDIPLRWDVGQFDRTTRSWIPDKAENIKWVAMLGSQTYSTPAVSGGKVFIGSDNSQGYLPRYPASFDLACLLCFSADDGRFLWQFSSEKIDEHHDFPGVGICGTPLVEGDRVWIVTNRGTVVCADTEGFRDGEDDGPVRNAWGTLFRVFAARDADDFRTAMEGLERGALGTGIRQRFADAGVPLPEEPVGLSKSEGGWDFAIPAGAATRKLRIEIHESELVALKQITPEDEFEADVVWVFDMMGELGVSQHNMANGSIAMLGDLLFVSTSNGVDESHERVTAPSAPSLIAMDKRTGKVHWTDNSPGENILHGQWSSPTVATLGGVPQVLFAAGDGWLYSFRADAGRDGRPELLWQFDTNPKDSEWEPSGSGDRNSIIASPVVSQGRVYVTVGEDPEYADGEGHLWCIDPTRRGDVSPTLVVGADGKSAPRRRVRAIEDPATERIVDNPNSAVIWHYRGYDLNQNGMMEYEEQMHRSIASPGVHENLVFMADFGGILHCLDAATGRLHWTHDLFAGVWATPLVANGHVFVADDDGDVTVFKLTDEAHEPVGEINMRGPVYSSPIVVDGVLYLANRSHLFAIASPEPRP